MYGVSGLAGNLFGPALGEYVIHSYGFASFFIMLAGFGVLGIIIASTMRVQRHHHDTEATHSLYTVARSKGMPLVMVLAAFLALAYSTPTTFMAAVALSRGITGFGLYFTGYGLAGIMIRFIGATWGDRFGSLKVLVPAFFFYGAGLLLVAFSTSTVMVFIAGLVTGFSHGLAFPAVAILGYSVAPRSAAGTAMALVTGTMDAGQAYTALIIGPLAEVFGYGLVFPFAAAGCFAAVLITLRTLRVRGKFVEGA
jgi:predicted MFS family arabinose efflux permease